MYAELSWYIRHLTTVEGYRKHNTLKQFNPVCHVEGVTINISSHTNNSDPKIDERVVLYANRKGSRSFPIPENYYPGFKKIQENARFVFIGLTLAYEGGSSDALRFYKR